MLKGLLIGINFIGLLLFNWFLQDNLSVEQNLPTTLGPGESKDVTVTINKNDISGFAKYQLTVSEGLSVSVLDGAGASFTFNDQKAKFIWMSLPNTREFTFKFRIESTMSATGSQTVDSRFSYIFENDRKNYDLPQALISINGSTEPAISDNQNEEDNNTILNVDADASAKRKIIPLGNDKYKVEITINKFNLAGFAKIEETIPESYTAVNIDGKSSVFSIDDQKVKYIWFDIPQDESLTITYQLLAVVTNNIQEPEISGKFSFPKGDVTEDIIIGGMSIPQIETIDMHEVAESSAEDSADSKEEPADYADESKTIAKDKSITITPDIEVIQDSIAKIEEQEIETEETAESNPEEEIAQTVKEERDAVIVNDSKTQVLSKGRADGNIANVPEPESGISYRVQIAAGKNNLNKEVFAKLYNFGEGLKLENHKGWFKYTTGYFDMYKDARDDRQRITKQYEKFKGPFVTAYNDGDRITVQEALMVTKQKWYP